MRMILNMAVQLYTVRVVLKALGSVDYGLYNVVGGVVTMFAFLSSTMANASQRYFSYEIGRGDYKRLKEVFSITLITYCLLAIILFVLTETVGLWLLNNKLVVPPERLTAANWVFQFSILTFLLTMFQTPYDAIVIAHEKMNVYAYVSILEVSLKLLIVYLLQILPFDKLMSYAVLISIVTLITTSIYKIYCLKNYSESHFKWFWDRKLFKEITTYSGWSLFGALASIGNNQGINILLNLFFGPKVNASRGISYQLNSSINGFVQNFMTASRPQIIKYYAQGDLNNMEDLVYRSGKFSFFLLFIVSLPLIFETDYILTLWLNDLPIYITFFTRLIILTTLVDTMAYALITASQATGKLKYYQIVVGGCLLLNLPIGYLLLKMGLPPQSIFMLTFINSCICLYLRIYMLKGMLGFSIPRFLKKVVVKSLMVVVLVYVPLYFLSTHFPESFLRFLLITVIGVLWSIIVIFFAGIDKQEKEYLFSIIDKLKKKFKLR